MSAPFPKSSPVLPCAQVLDALVAGGLDVAAASAVPRLLRVAQGAPSAAMLSALLTSGVPLSSLSPVGLPAEYVEVALAQGLDVCTQCAGWLHRARDGAVVTTLVAAGADPNAWDAGETPLHTATRGDTVRALVAAGVWPFLRCSCRAPCIGQVSTITR
jgi:hypothetical protein